MKVPLGPLILFAGWRRGLRVPGEEHSALGSLRGERRTFVSSVLITAMALSLASRLRLPRVLLLVLLAALSLLETSSSMPLIFASSCFAEPFERLRANCRNERRLSLLSAGDKAFTTLAVSRDKRDVRIVLLSNFEKLKKLAR